ETGGDIDIDDVPVLEVLGFVGDAVTDDVVAADADGGRKPMEAELARTSPASRGVLAHPALDLGGRNPRPHQIKHALQGPCGGLPRPPHPLNLLGPQIPLDGFHGAHAPRARQVRVQYAFSNATASGPGIACAP